MPAFVLKKMIMNNFTTQEVDEDIADSIDFMVERVSVTCINQTGTYKEISKYSAF